MDSGSLAAAEAAGDVGTPLKQHHADDAQHTVGWLDHQKVQWIIWMCPAHDALALLFQDQEVAGLPGWRRSICNSLAAMTRRAMALGNAIRCQCRWAADSACGAVQAMQVRRSPNNRGLVKEQFEACSGLPTIPSRYKIWFPLSFHNTHNTGSSDQNVGGGDAKRARQSFGDKMQRLLHIRSSNNAGSAADAPPSPAAARAPSPLLTRSLEASAFLLGTGHHRAHDDALMRASAPETPPRLKIAPASSTAGPSSAVTPPAAAAGAFQRRGKSLWGKLGSGMKGRKASPATIAARSSFEGPSAIELPVPSNGSSAGAVCAGSSGRGGGGGGASHSGSGEDLESTAVSCGGDDGASYDPRAEGEGPDGGGGGGRCDESFYSYSPSRDGSVGLSPYVARGGYGDETVDLRQVRLAGCWLGLLRRWGQWLMARIQRATLCLVV